MNFKIAGLDWLKAFALLGVVLLLHVVPIDRLEFYADSEMFDMLHVLGFTALTFLVATWLIRRSRSSSMSTRAAFVWAGGIVACVALMAEASQIVTQRDADVFDLMRDCTGIAGGLLFAAVFTRSIVATSRAVALGVLFVFAGLSTATYSFVTKTIVRQRFPVLATFEDPLDLKLIGRRRTNIEIIDSPKNWPEGNRVLMVQPIRRVAVDGRRRFAAVEFDEHPRDWSSYKSLSFRVSTVSAPMTTISVRINDEDHDGSFEDRFSRDYSIGETPQTISISLRDLAKAPASRAMDLSKIRRLVIFTSSEDGEAFYLDDLRLE